MDFYLNGKKKGDNPFSRFVLQICLQHCLVQVMILEDLTVLHDTELYPQFGKIVVLCANKVAMEKMAIVNTFGPIY